MRAILLCGTIALVAAGASTQVVAGPIAAGMAEAGVRGESSLSQESARAERALGSGLLIVAADNQGAAPGADSAKQDPTNPVRETTIKQKLTGSNIARDVQSSIVAPPNKQYSELTTDEKRLVKAQYVAMADEDEPPYPINGHRNILMAAEKAQYKYRANGELSVLVDVNANGEATKISVMKSPDDDLTMDLARVLMLQKYKPAMCKGVPCNMQFPFRMTFVLDHTLAP